MQVYILCGGKSSRMQSEKGLVLYQNKTFIDHVIDAVLPISKNIQLVTNSKDYDHLKYTKVKDLVEDKGPLGGIYSALVDSKTEINLILSCDIPLISTPIIQKLIDNHATNFDISIFGNSERMHPLIGLYSKNSIPSLEKAIELNTLKMIDFVLNSKHQLVSIEEEEKKFFKNINSQADLLELI